MPDLLGPATSVAAAIFFIGLTGCVTTPEETVAWGRNLAESNCASCHAIGPEGGSPNAFAPEFRNLRQTRTLMEIERTFTSGQIVDHPPMPSFAVRPDETRALMAYIQSVQTDSDMPWPRRIFR